MSKSNREIQTLYDKKVKHVEKVERNLSSSSSHSSSSVGAALGLKHKGVKVTLEDDSEYLVHKGGGFGKSWQTVVVPAEEAGNWNNWKTVDEHRVRGNVKLRDYVEEGGKDYSLMSDNCWNGTDRMWKLGK